jgi:hypothetical protein
VLVFPGLEVYDEGIKSPATFNPIPTPYKAIPVLNSFCDCKRLGNYIFIYTKSISDFTLSIP